MNLLTGEHMTKSFTGRMLLEDTAFSIQDGEKIGVTGINGAGKSTLLKILAGMELLDEGQLTKGNQVKLEFLPQTPVFSKEQTVLDGAMEGCDRLDLVLESEAKTMLMELQFTDFTQPVSQLSGGQKKRIALVNVLMKQADILLLDEPTNHLDHEMSEWLEQYLIDFRGAIVMVTHDRYFLDRVSNRIVEVEKGKLYSYPGNYSEYVALKAQRQNMELATERKRQSILRKELEWLARGARARSTKQKAHIQRIDQMQQIQAPQEETKLQMSSMASRMGKKTLELKDISKAYGEKKLIQDFEYIFLKQDRIGIIGPNGCGKSTLLKIITGEVTPDSGKIEIGQTVKIGYFSQESEQLDPEQKAIDFVKESGEYIQTPEGKITASMMMERFLFDGAMQWSKIEKLSGGERRRLYLLHILMSAPNLLILDEPTNDLDIQTLTILEDYLDSFDGIVITVSHDRYFLERIVRRMFSFEGDGVITQHEGGYLDYLARKQETQKKAALPAENKEKKENNAAKTGRTRERKLKFTFKEAREYETIDSDIETLESKIEQLDAQIAKEASNYGKLNALTIEKQEVEAQLEEKMERWVYLNDLAEQIEKSNS